jgi:hypothetical protein
MLGATAASIMAYADDQEKETEATGKIDLEVGSDEAESKEVEPSKLDLPLGNDMLE